MTHGRRLASAVGITATICCAMALWHDRGLIRGNIIALVDLPYNGQAPASLVSPVEARLVAHAGGAVEGHTYTNTHEALDRHYAEGYRLFELDFQWTSDDRMVVVHDWAEISAQVGTRPHVFSYAEYLSAKRRDGLHQLTVEDLRKWLQIHRDALIVTDTKENNIRFLRYLEANDREIGKQLVIQIYRMSELQEARLLDPKAVWLTVYKYSIPPWALSRIVGVDAFVIPVGAYERYRNPSLMARVHFYVHSIPARSVDQTFGRLPGIYGIYVD